MGALGARAVLGENEGPHEQIQLARGGYLIAHRRSEILKEIVKLPSNLRSVSSACLNVVHRHSLAADDFPAQSVCRERRRLDHPSRRSPA
jgi:hypothetical protein